jgi:hypothetical protein
MIKKVKFVRKVDVGQGCREFQVVKVVREVRAARGRSRWSWWSGR